MRTPWPAVAAGLVAAALGAAGLIRAAVPQSASAGAPPSAPIIVTGAYVRAPVPPTTSAAAYFTVSNTTDKADRLTSVVSGAGESTVLHTTVAGRMTVSPNGVVIPPHGQLVLQAGQGHVMIEKVFGTLRAGDNVNLVLSFDNAGDVNVNARVIAAGALAPVSDTGSSARPSPSK
jgi:copper(I)-binding protein